MPFLLPLIFLADLMAAALTFAVVASVPAWRRSAITAPVFVFIAAPVTSLFCGLALMRVGGWTHYGTRYPMILLVMLGLAAGAVLAAYVAGLVCRFVFNNLAPRMEQWLGLRQFLILQAAILCGGALSLLVLLILIPNLALQIWNWGPRWGAFAAGLVGAFGVLACLLAFFRLPRPEQYLPKPLPEFLRRRMLREAIEVSRGE